MTVTGRARGRSERVERSRLARIPLVLGVAAVAVGVGMVAWAWFRPVGRDPYTTFVNAEPTRYDYGYFVPLTVGGATLATLGLVAVVVGVVVSLLRARRST